MWRSWKLGTAFGIGLYVHWTFLLLPVWVFVANWQQFGVDAAAHGVALILTIFGCVLLHELGHALTARRFGIPTRDITLYPIGGVARLERMSEWPWEEFWIALGGPAVNVVIAAVLIPLALALGSSFSAEEIVSIQFIGAGSFLAQVSFFNLFLAFFNMLPAFPMDGGRVLRALLATFLGRLTATEIAAALGIAMSVAFFFASVWKTSPTLMLLSVFVMLMGQRELAAIRHQERHRQAEILEVLPADLDVIGVGALPARPNFSGFTWDGQRGMWVEWRDGSPVHTISVQ